MDDIYRAIQFLAARCDGAKALDGQGFNRLHSVFGLQAASLNEEDWSIEIRWTAYKLIQHYSNQLSTIGIVPSKIPAPEKPVQEEAVRRMAQRQIDQLQGKTHYVKYTTRGLLVNWGGYNATILNDFKNFFPGSNERKWDADNTKDWFVFLLSLEAIENLFIFCKKHRIRLTDEAASIIQLKIEDFERNPGSQKESVKQAPKVKIGRFIQPVDDLNIRVCFDYDEEMLKQWKELGIGVWHPSEDPYDKFWLVNIADETVVQKVIDFADDFGFEWRGDLRQRILHAKEIAALAVEESMRASTDFRFDGLLREPYPFQWAGCEWGVKYKRTIIGDEPGCIDGDALISINRGGNGKKVKLRDLYRKFNGLEGSKPWAFNIDTYARSLQDGVFRLNQITGVYKKGVKQVLLLTLSDGKTLRLTADHEVKTPDGWVAAGDLKSGNCVLANGTQICPSCGGTSNLITYKYSKFLGYCKTCMYRQMRTQGRYEDGEVAVEGDYVYVSSGLRYHPHVSKKGLIPKHRLIYEANMNGLTLEDWLAVIFNNGFNKHHKFLDPAVEIHHKNEDKHDNRLENLQMVTVTQHRKIHEAYKRLPVFIPKSVEVVSIVHDGETEVYDITVENAHNFVANGIVVHNCGKTIQSIAITQYLNAFPALCIVPKTVDLNWAREWSLTLTGKTVKVFSESTDWKYCDVFIINYDMLARKVKKGAKETWKDVLLQRKWDTIIADEAHMLKNSSTLRFKAVKELAKTCSVRLMLTGTPILNRPKELITLLDITDRLKDFGGWKSFTTRYCSSRPIYVKGKLVQQNAGAHNLSELHSKLRSTGSMIRRLKKDVLKDLPPKTYTIIPIELDNQDEYDRAEEDVIDFISKLAAKDKEFLESIAHLDDEDQATMKRQHMQEAATKAERAQVLVEINTLRQLAAKGKMAAVKEWITEFHENGEKLVFFGWHRNVVEGLAQEFNAPSITGDTTNRQVIVDRFQNDPECTDIFLNIQAGGIGITLTAASNVGFIELPWTPAFVDQAIDRCHRIGQEDAVTGWFLLAPNTIDMDMYEMIATKRNIINQAMDGMSPDEQEINAVNDVMQRMVNRQKTGQLELL